MSIVGKGTRYVSGFSPTSIPECALWLDATDSNAMTLSGSTVTTWRDKSGNGRNATSSGNPVLSTAVFGGQPSILFDGASDMRGDISITGNTYTAFVVAQLTRLPTASPARDRRILTFATVGTYSYDNSNRILPINVQNNVYPNRFTLYRVNFIATSSSTVSIDTPYIIASQYNGANGLLFVNSTSGTIVNATSGNLTITRYGIANEVTSTGEFLYGYIGEVIVYTSSLSTTDRQIVEGYLATKWQFGTTGIVGPTLSLGTFSPSNVSTLGLWLDAADASTFTYSSGSNISAWNDKSGNGRNFTATQGNFTRITDGGRSVVNMTSNVYMTSTTALTVTSNQSWVFVVTKMSSTPLTWMYLMNFNPDGDKAFRYLDGVFRSITGMGGDQNEMTTPGQAYINGVFDTSATFSNYHQINAPIQSSRTTTSITLSSPFNARYYLGTLAEVLIYTGPITQSERKNIEWYLSTKWGVPISTTSLPVTHPFRRSLPVMRPFQPVDISGCALWLDGLDPSGTGVRPANGTTISTWVDKSGGGQNATAGGTTPIYSNSMVNFNGNGYVSNTAFTYSLQNRSVFIVASQTSSSSASAFEGIFILGATGGNYDYADVNSCVYLGRGSNGGQNDAFGVYLAGDYIVSYLTNAVPAPFAVYSDVFGSNSGTLYANGNTAQSDTTVGTIGSGTGYLVGARYYGGPAAFLNGGVSEIIMYRTALTAGQRQQVETYLANKWGLRGLTPAGHYARLAPALTTQFNPLLIAGCRLWLDSADTTTVSVSGSNVTQWTDRSGNGFNFTVRSGDSNPVYTSNAVNGLNALSFTGSGGENATDMMLRNTSISVNVSAYSMFVVARQNASSPSPYGANYIMGTVSGSPLLYGTYTGGNFITSVGSTGSFNDLTVNSPNTQMKSTSVTGMVVNGSVLTPYFNGTAMTTKNGATGSYTGLDIGASGGGQTWQGFICEILIFNSAITTTERQFVEGYLANKWGTATSLPAGHPFKTAKP